MRAIAFAICCLTIVQCGADQRRVVMKTLSLNLDEHFHRCVPLGWMPVATAGSYYSNYSIEYRPEGVWLRPFWLGAIFEDARGDPHVEKVARVMDALARAGLVREDRSGGGRIYRLLPEAIPYYSEDDSYGDNPEHLPFLCYTRIVPAKIVWLASTPRGTLQVTFSWNESAAAGWANAYLRAHSVILPPLENPVTALLQEDQYGWHMRRLRSALPMLGRVANPRAWRT